MTPVRPNFFLVGAPKCGTSALFEHLGRHPQIFVPALKEPHFFGADQEFLKSRRITLDEYLALFRDAGEAVKVGDGSTNYLYSRTAPHEIRSFSPDAKVIVMLRDPIAVMHAYHGEKVAGGSEPIRDFGAALAAEERRRSGLDLPDRRGLRHSLYYRDIVDFSRHVGRYFDVFGRDRVHVILFEDWAASTAAEYKKTLEFLGVDHTFNPELGVVNPSKLLRSARLHDFIFQPPKSLQRLAQALPTPIRNAVRYKLIAANIRRGPRASIDPALLSELREEFEPQVRSLSTLIGRSLSDWQMESGSLTGSAASTSFDQAGAGMEHADDRRRSTAARR
jgi:hypothetical protein